MRKAALALLLFFLVPLSVDAQNAWARWPGYTITIPGLAANGSSLTATVPILLPDGTAAAPSLAFTSDPTMGFSRTSPNITSWSTTGIATPWITFSAGNFQLRSDKYVAWADGANSNGTVDLKLYRGAANTLYMKNSTNPQAFWLANTDDGAGNYERGGLRWNANTLQLFTEAGGTGTARPVQFTPANIDFALSASPRPGSDDTYDLGLITTVRQWRNLYLSRSIQGSKSKTLTDNVATSFVRLAIADDDYEACEVGYTAYAEDADTDARQVRVGSIHVACLNNSGTEACSYDIVADSVATVTGGTFTCTFGSTSAVADTIDLQATCDTSLNAAAETLTFEWRLDCHSPVTITPQ